MHILSSLKCFFVPGSVNGQLKEEHLCRNIKKKQVGDVSNRSKGRDVRQYCIWRVLL